MFYFCIICTHTQCKEEGRWALGGTQGAGTSGLLGGSLGLPRPSGCRYGEAELRGVGRNYTVSPDPRSTKRASKEAYKTAGFYKDLTIVT